MATRPRVVRATLAAIALVVAPALSAQPYPAKPVQVIVPYLAGGPADVGARIVAQGLSERLGQPFVVINRPGAGGNIGSEQIAQAAPDGYTLGIGGSTTGANVGLYPTLPYDPVKSFAPISIHYRDANILVVNPSSPINSVADLVKLAKAKPGELTFSSSGNGTSTHLSGELFNQMAGTKITHVPYKGVPPAIADVMGGQVTMMFASSTIVAPQIKAGKVKAIAITSAKRSAVLPDVPTFAEAGMPGFESYAWYGFFAPAKTPPDIIAKLNEAALKVMKSPEWQRVLAETGSENVGESPAQFAAFTKAEATKWAKVVKDSGATID